MRDNLSFLFEPASVAIVGATEDTRRLGGGTILSFLKRHGFRGQILPINPKHNEIDGTKCYASLMEAPGPIDLAVFAVPANILHKTLQGISKGYVKVALVLTSGFGEMGPEGERLEEEIIRIANEREIAFVGPNSVGAVNAWVGLTPTISQFFDRDTVVGGPLALVSQSGAFGTALLAQCEREGLHFGYFVSSGNESQLEFSAYARYLIQQDKVKTLCGYIESVRNGTGFVALGREALKLNKPIILLKVGSTEAGAAAARSHTGALVGADEVAQCFFDALNIIRAVDGQDLLDLLRVFERTPTARGKRLAILSHSGGAGVMAADAAQIAGAEIAQLPDDLVARLAQRLPAFATVRNPLDMTGGASLNAKLMGDCLREILRHPAIDAALLCVNLIWREGRTLVDELSAIAAQIDKPFAVSWVAPSADLADSLRSATYPVFADPARAAQALTRRLAYDQRCRELAEEPVSARPARLTRSSSLPAESAEDRSALLRAYGVRLPRQSLTSSIEEALQFKATTDNRVALKIMSADIAHRTEIGAVAVDIDDEEELRIAFDRVIESARTHFPNAKIDGVLVQEMVRGLEVLVGLKRDDTFGPVIVFGPGGTLVELIKQVEMYPAPLSRSQAERALESSVLHRLLQGYRGGPPLDGEALAELIESLSWLAKEQTQIRELELNPVMVMPEGRGCVAVDYKLTL